MDIYQKIFEERIRLDLKGQPAYGASVLELTDWFRTKTRERHPYGAEAQHCDRTCYNMTADGDDAVLPFTDYMYRLSHVGSVFYKDAPKARYQGLTAPYLFNMLRTKQSAQSRKWLSLEEFFEKGKLLPGSRNCTWWTPSKLESDPVLPSAHKVGMVNGWVKLYSLILRIPSYEFFRLSLKVPTPIDAFDKCIFLTPTVPDASIGRAIDLDRQPDFDYGHPETIGTEIPVEIIEALPVEVTDKERGDHRVDLVPILPSLLQFYESR